MCNDVNPSFSVSSLKTILFVLFLNHFVLNGIAFLRSFDSSDFDYLALKGILLLLSFEGENESVSEVFTTA